MEIENLYTIELKRVLTYISKDLIEEYPSKKITTEYFIFSLFNNKQCLAYKILDKFVTQKHMDDLYDYYAKYLHNNSSTIIKKENNLQVGYDSIFSNHLVNSEQEKDGLLDPKVSTEHVLLSILKTNSIVKKQFETFGVTYDSFLTQINELRYEDVKKNDSDRALVESISGFKSNKSGKKNLIETYCINLNKLSQQGKIDELIGRESEINRIVKVLGRRNKNNVILVGLPGTGKSQIVNGLVNLIEKGKAMFLNGKTVLSLNITAIIAGSTFRGMLEDRMNGIINEIKYNKDCVLFIDDIHNVLGNNTNNSTELVGVLSNTLSDGDVQVIATTSFKEYKNTIEGNASLSRKFQKIIIEPTTLEETEMILHSSKVYYEKHHNVLYSNESIKACVHLANKYITERQLPDSAIDIMDECGSEKKIYNPEMDDLVDLRKELMSAQKMREKSMKMNDFKLGDEYNKKAKEIEGKIIDYEKNLKLNTKNKVKEINEDDIYSTVSDMTGIPLNKLSTSEKQKYLNIENVLNEHVIGQEEAIKNISQTLKRNRIGLNRKNRPVGVFLFSGVSGVGKTLLASKIADEIYDGEKSLVRFDMSEYSDKTSVNKLIGAGSGYVMAEQGGLLTEAIKNNQYSVLLLDEIEKADKDVLNVFLQVFDNGVLTDNTGVKVSFKNTIIIMTSNIGARDASMIGGGVGFNTNVESNKKSIVEKSIKSFFNPEFINRLDKIIQFNELTNDDLKKIIVLELKKLNVKMVEIGYSINYSDNVVDFIFNKLSSDKTSGARKINRIVQSEIEDIICDLYLENEYDKGHMFSVEIDNNNVKIL